MDTYITSTNSQARDVVCRSIREKKQNNVIFLMITKSTGSNETASSQDDNSACDNLMEDADIEEDGLLSSVFIDASIYDEKENIKKLEHFSKEHCIKYSSPIISKRPSQYTKELNTTLLNSDYVVLPVENTPQRWINERIRLYNRVLSKRPRPLNIRIYNPSKKNIMALIPEIRHQNLHIVECTETIECFQKGDYYVR